MNFSFTKREISIHNYPIFHTLKDSQKKKNKKRISAGSICFCVDTVDIVDIGLIIN